MAFDVVTYILSKKYAESIISTLPTGFIYKGSVSYQKDLPTTAELGWVYTVVYRGESGSNPWGAEFVCDSMEGGSAHWLQLGASYDQQIAELLVKINSKQDILVDSGENQNIKTINNQSIIGKGNLNIDTTIGRDFITNITVGNIPSGTSISSTDKLSDIIYKMLRTDIPVVNYLAYELESYIKPSSITSDWRQFQISTSAKTEGWSFTVVSTLDGYLSFAVDTRLGPVKHLYQNGIVVDILNDFIRSEVTYNGITYYMYVADELAKIHESDTFKLIWN